MPTSDSIFPTYRCLTLPMRCHSKTRCRLRHWSGETATTFSAMAGPSIWTVRRSRGSGSMFLAHGRFWGGRLRQRKIRRARTAVAVLSYGAWQKVFGGDRNVIGQTVMLNQKPYRVIGVMRSDFDWPRGKEVWTPMGLEPKEYNLDNRFNEGSMGVVRLQSGVSFAQFKAG